jgi:ATP-dependent DNA helicase RecQ
MDSSCESFADRVVQQRQVDPNTARVFAFAAVRGGGGEALAHKDGSLEAGLDRLEAFCKDARHLIAHNILRHDLPHLVANRARLADLGAAAIDTQRLNPLAFPRNSYHHLVKHYQDGRLQAEHVNDPKLDARLVLQVLADQIAAFGKLGLEVPDALLAYHHPTTRGEAAGFFDALFQHLGGASAPDAGEAHAAIRRLLAGLACDHRLNQTLGRLSDRHAVAGRWPMRCRGSRLRAETRSYDPGCGCSSAMPG